MNSVLTLPPLRSPLRQLSKYLINRLTSKCNGNALERSALVFAPHPDDETLGCGGTIIRKKRAGAAVKIVFMTAGCRSNQHLISENEMKSIRVNEALAAAQVLGVAPSDVVFLEFKDTELDKNLHAAIHQVRAILLHEQPDEIFIPYHKEPLSVPDHFATNRIVLSALQTCRRKTIVYEYPIWFWFHWPWTSHGRRRALISSLNLLKDFRYAVYIKDVLETKRIALEKHQSQVKGLSPASRYTLSNVSNGEFLECFFQDYEIFCQYSFPIKD